MEIISQKTYSVMDGEPQLGRQVESIVRVGRDEYMEALVDVLLNGADGTDDKVIVVDDGYVQEYTLGDDLNQNDIDNILQEMNMNLIDDDYGSDKAWELLSTMLDDILPVNWSDEFETIEMRG